MGIYIQFEDGFWFRTVIQLMNKVLCSCYCLCGDAYKIATEFDEREEKEIRSKADHRSRLDGIDVIKAFPAQEMLKISATSSGSRPLDVHGFFGNAELFVADIEFSQDAQSRISLNSQTMDSLDDKTRESEPPSIIQSDQIVFNKPRVVE